MPNDKMLCPDCGVEMNLHAEKLIYGDLQYGQESIDPDLGGVLEETHACPECGRSASRQVGRWNKGR